MNYKFNEDELVKELKEYIDSTYDQHYATNKYQATDVIIDAGHGEGFCIGNIIKYAKRYGKKGDSTEQRKDLMKILHYAIIVLNLHDKTTPYTTTTNVDEGSSPVWYIPSEDVDPDTVNVYTEFTRNEDEVQGEPVKLKKNRLNDLSPVSWDHLKTMTKELNETANFIREENSVKTRYDDWTD